MTTNQEGHMGTEIARTLHLPDEQPLTFEHEGHSFEIKSDRIVRDGKEVCVLVSPGFGAGFITWNDCISPMNPKLVALVLAGQRGALVQAKDEGREADVAEWLGLPEDTFLSLNGARDLEIYYVPIGSRFRLDEYDGAESVEVLDADGWTIA